MNLLIFQIHTIFFKFFYAKFVTLRIFQKIVKNVKKMKKSISSCEIKKRSHLIIYGTRFFLKFVHNFSTLLSWKIFIFDIHNIFNFFRFLLYRKLLKLWSYQTFGCECIREASLGLYFRDFAVVFKDLSFFYKLVIFFQFFALELYAFLNFLFLSFLLFCIFCFRPF